MQTMLSSNTLLPSNTKIIFTFPPRDLKGQKLEIHLSAFYSPVKLFEAFSEHGCFMLIEIEQECPQKDFPPITFFRPNYSKRDGTVGSGRGILITHSSFHPLLIVPFVPRLAKH